MELSLYSGTATPEAVAPVSISSILEQTEVEENENHIQGIRGVRSLGVKRPRSNVGHTAPSKLQRTVPSGLQQLSKKLEFATDDKLLVSKANVQNFDRVNENGSQSGLVRSLKPKIESLDQANDPETQKLVGGHSDSEWRNLQKEVARLKVYCIAEIKKTNDMNKKLAEKDAQIAQFVKDANAEKESLTKAHAEELRNVTTRSDDEKRLMRTTFEADKLSLEGGINNLKDAFAEKDLLIGKLSTENAALKKWISDCPLTSQSELEDSLVGH